MVDDCRPASCSNLFRLMCPTSHYLLHYHLTQHCPLQHCPTSTEQPSTTCSAPVLQPTFAPTIILCPTTNASNNIQHPTGRGPGVTLLVSAHFHYLPIHCCPALVAPIPHIRSYSPLGAGHSPAETRLQNTSSEQGHLNFVTRGEYDRLTVRAW